MVPARKTACNDFALIVKLLEIKKLRNSLEDLKKEIQIKASSNVKRVREDLLEMIDEKSNFVSFLRNLGKENRPSRGREQRPGSLPKVDNSKLAGPG